LIPHGQSLILEGSTLELGSTPTPRKPQNAIGLDLTTKALTLAPLTTTEVPRLTIRPARVGDVPGIYERILVYADQKLMIRRTMAELYESIREFVVAVDDRNRVVGCAALHVFWEDLAEIRCLAVDEQFQGAGLGRRLVAACWEMARELEIQSTFALTKSARFFERCGYNRIDKSELPQRIWNECVRCPSFPNCEEIAFVRASEPAPATQSNKPTLATAEI
jgi:amino-acid N-acetyltransferase